MPNHGIETNQKEKQDKMNMKTPSGIYKGIQSETETMEKICRKSKSENRLTDKARKERKEL